MEFILIMIAATLMSGFLCVSFYLGMKYEQSQKESSNKLEINEDNAESIGQLMEWMGYRGKK